MTTKAQKKMKRAQAAAAAAAAASSSSRPSSPHRGGSTNKQPSKAAKKKTCNKGIRRSGSPSAELTEEQKQLFLALPRQLGGHQVLGGKQTVKEIAGVARSNPAQDTNTGVDHVQVNPATSITTTTPALATAGSAAGPAMRASSEADLVLGNATGTAGDDDTMGSGNNITLELNPTPSAAPTINPNPATGPVVRTSSSPLVEATAAGGDHVGANIIKPTPSAAPTSAVPSTSTTPAPDASAACASSTLITEEDAAADQEVAATTGATAGGEIVNDEEEEDEEETTATTITRAASVSPTDRVVDGADVDAVESEAAADVPKVNIIIASPACPSSAPEALSTSYFSKILGAVTSFFGGITAAVREAVAVGQFCWYFSGFWA